MSNRPDGSRLQYTGHQLTPHGGKPTTFLGWSPTCTCASADPVPCSVLDPFAGIGRTGEVCYELGRRYMPADISIGYAAIQHRRLADHRTVARGKALRAVDPMTITGPLIDLLEATG